MAGRKSKEIWEFGDFQTPDRLAVAACKVLSQMGIAPSCVLEPTCGRGSFLSAAAETFASASRIIGVDINPQHLDHASARLAPEISAGRVDLLEGNFFKVDWPETLQNCPGSWLILGNPPWVTSAELGLLASENLPEKSNFHGRTGIDALTGKSNFDISEWMLHRYLEWLNERGGHIAILVKTVVARKLLSYAWKRGYPIKAAAIYKIDAMAHFEAAVDACFFVLTIEPGSCALDCAMFEDIGDTKPSHKIGFRDEMLIADADAYKRHRHLAGQEPHYVWRSGIKHDCAKVMELVAENGHYRNGLGEPVMIEDSFVYPLLKSSDVNNGNGRGRFMLVTQQTVGEDTGKIQSKAPRTWDYLQSHAALLDKRGSVIYRKRPPFSIFGVGDYSFAPWKVAISGFYKKLRFVAIGPTDDRPTVFDDTVYFLPCYSEAEAQFLVEILSSRSAQEFYNSMIFWADKRPITNDTLKRLSLAKLSESLGRSDEYDRFTEAKRMRQSAGQLLLLQAV